jgi:hypothetical protein
MESSFLPDKGLEYQDLSRRTCPHCTRPLQRQQGLLMHVATGSANCYPGQYHIPSLPATEVSW